jgi:mono/diheme cytochrome c family protein
VIPELVTMLRKILKITGRIALGFLALIVVALTAIYAASSYRLHKKHVVNVPALAIEPSASLVERGHHIVETRACGDCHGKDFGGNKVIDDPLAGVFNAPNLTRGEGGLPADFNDTDYVRAIRHGLARDGRPLVLMPSAEYTMMSDEDTAGVVAYLKSLPPVNRPRGKISPGPLVRALLVAGQIKLAAEEINHTTARVASVVPAITPEYGKYLAAGCTGCHGANFSGGKIAGAPPDWPSAANLTSHASSRVSQWNEEQFIATVRTRKRPDGSELNPIMPAAFASMTDVEVKALWSYIKTLPAVATGVR